MTRDEIIRMAREAGFRAGHIELYSSDPMPFVAPCSATDCLPELVRFAALIAAAERAKLYALPGAQAQPAPSVPEGWNWEAEIHKVAKRYMSKKVQGYFMESIRAMLAAAPKPEKE